MKFKVSRERAELLRRNGSLFVAFKMCLTLMGAALPCSLLKYEACGLAKAEFAWLQAIFGIVFAPLLVGGGYFADRVGRRRTLVLGALCFSAGWTAYAVAQSFGGLVVAESLLALGFGFMAGAEHALVFDSLKAIRLQAKHATLRSRALAAGSAVQAVLGVWGAYIAGSILQAPFVVAAVGGALAAAVAACMVEPPRTRAPRSKMGEHFRGIFAQAFVVNADVRRIMVVSALLLGVSHASLPFLQLTYKELGVDPKWFGWVGLCTNGLVACTAFTHARIIKRCGETRAFLVPSIAHLVAFLGLALAPLGGGLSAAVLLFWARGYQETLVADVLNPKIGSADRSAINGTLFGVARIVQVLLLLPLGGVVAILGARAAMLVLAPCAVLPLIVGALYVVWEGESVRPQPG